MKIDTSAYNFNHLPDLTEEQKSNPFSKFYYEPVTDPEKEILDACGELPLCADDVLDFKDIRRIFEPDPGLKNGWCILPDGTGYTSLMTYMPQITPEIEAWWSSWMMDPACDYLNYRIWMPGLHESHAMPIMENLGWGTLCIHMEKPLFPPMLLGTQNPKDIDPGYLMEMGSAGCSVLKADPNGERFYSVLISCIKKADTGIKFQTVNYIGVTWENGTLIKMHNADEERVRLFLMHNAYEFHHKAEIAGKLYAYAATLPNHGLRQEHTPRK